MTAVLAVAMLTAAVDGSVAAPPDNSLPQPDSVSFGRQAVVTSAQLAKKPKCGKKILKPNGKKWRCTLSSKFGGRRLPSQWQTLTTPEDGYRSGADCYVDEAKTVRVRGGKLRLRTYAVPAPFFCKFGGRSGTMTQVRSGSISTLGRFAQGRGRYEIRVRFPKAKGAGVQSAIWLHPVDVARYGAYPASGEIDIVERFSRYPKKLFSFAHYLGNAQDPQSACGLKTKKKWHTIVLVWSKKRLRTYFDGRHCLNDRWISTSQTTAPEPFNQPFSIVLTQGAGIGDNAYVPGRSPVPGAMKVDWVKVWR